MSGVSGLDLPEDGTGIGFCDWDHDGDLDLWVSNRSAPQVRFFQNRGAGSGKSLRLLLEGRDCNRDAIGARVVMEIVGGKPITRTLRAGDGYLSQSSKWLHFGIGQGEVGEVEVRWPGGESERFSGLRSGAAYRLRQGDGRASVWVPPAVASAVFVKPEPPGAAAPEETTAIVLAIPLPLPALEYETDSGETAQVFGTPLEGRRGLLVNLWATWCSPCITELEQFVAAKEQLDAAGVGVLALSVDGLSGGAGAKRLAVEKLRGLGFPFHSGAATERLIEFLQITNDELLVAQRPLPVPTSFLIDHNWRLIAIYKGKVEPSAAIAELGRLGLPFEQRRPGTLPFGGRWHFAPRNFVMLDFAGRLFERGCFELGGDLLERYARFFEPQPLFPELLATAGAHCATAGRDDQAHRLFRWALEQDPNRVVALVGLARILSENLILQDHGEAVKLAERAAGNTGFRDAAVLYTLALCLKNADREERAAEVVEQALSLLSAGHDDELRARLEALMGTRK